MLVILDAPQWQQRHTLGGWFRKGGKKPVAANERERRAFCNCDSGYTLRDRPLLDNSLAGKSFRNGIAPAGISFASRPFCEKVPKPRLRAAAMSSWRYSGVYWPADLDMLQRVFDRLCDERRLAKKDREQREYLAKEVFQVFDDGTRDEGDLLRALTKRRRA